MKNLYLYVLLLLATTLGAQTYSPSGNQTFFVTNLSDTSTLVGVKVKDALFVSSTAKFYKKTNKWTLQSTIPTGSPSGSDGQIQFNNSGAFGASSNNVWDNVKNTLRVGVEGDKSNIVVSNFAVLGKTGTGGYGAVGSNFYLDTDGQPKRLNADYVSVLDFGAGGFNFRTGASAAAGTTVSFTYLARLLYNGNFTIGNGTVDLGARLGIKGSGSTSASTSLLVQNSSGTEAFRIKDNQEAVFGGTVTLKSYTVATLPAGTVGMNAYVTDALAPTYLTTVVGGGAVNCPVFFDGTNWVAH